jgi:hypothetical protein
MELIQKNPYRIVGVLANANLREIVKQQNALTRYVSIGKNLTSQYDFSFLDLIQRLDLTFINKAIANIQQSQDKLNHSIFWFVNQNSFDNTAIEYLINNDKQKAIDIWEKVTNQKEVTDKNYSCFNNLGTIKLLSNLKQDLQQGIALKIKLIESSFYNEFVLLVAGQTLILDNQKQIEKFINDIVNEFSKKYNPIELLNLFHSCNEVHKKQLVNKLAETPLYNIELKIENAKNKRNTDKNDCYNIGLDLYFSTSEDLQLLKEILKESNLKFKNIADQLANEILQCGIEYFNENKKVEISEKHFENTQKLTDCANQIAQGHLTKSRIQDSIETLADIKDSEINLAITVLSSIKSAYEEACKKIDKQVDDLQYRTVMGTKIRNHNVNVDWTKVLEMKSICLDWDKVVDLVCENISLKNIEKIKVSNNVSKQNEYKQLVEFLITKLDNKHKNKINHICYWKEIKSYESSSGCYIATMAYGDYNHPQVLILRKFRDEVLNNYLFGKYFIKTYYKYSPSLVIRLKNKIFINNLIRKFLNQIIKIIQ